MSIGIVTGIIAFFTYVFLATDSKPLRGVCGALALTFVLVYLRLIFKAS